MKKNIRRIALVVITLVVGVLLYNFLRPGKLPDAPKGEAAPKPGRKVLSVTALVASSRPIVEYINSAGTLMADEAVELSFESSGRITELNIHEGQKVQKGALIAKINDNELQAQLDKLNVQHKLAEDREMRQRALLHREAISQESYEQSLTELQVLKAEIAQLEAKIEKSSIRAPFDGVMGLRYTSEGAFVSPGTRVTQMVKISPLKVDFSIPERYAGVVQIGAPVLFRADGYNKPFTAKVYAVEPLVDSRTRTLTVRAMYPNANEALMPGRYVTVELQIKMFSNAIAIPNEALIPEMNGAKVYLYRGGKAQPVSVSTGIRTESEIQIVSGLAAGDTLITSGMLQLRTDLPVKLSEVTN